MTSSESFKLKIRITAETLEKKLEKTLAADNVRDDKISVSIKYLSNLWRTLEMPLVNCKINLILAWSENCVSSTVTSIIDIILWDFLILYQIFFSPQVKQSVIISNKHGMYELPHELPTT